MQREILVFVAFGGTDVGVGRLWSRDSGGRKTSSFIYEAAWLNHPHRFALSPHLPLAIGPQHFDTALPAAFTDCAPDSWGMKLMRRAERMAAETEARAARTSAWARRSTGWLAEFRAGTLSRRGV